MSFLKKHSKIITILFLMILISAYLKLWLSSDEYFTIEMIKRSYHSIVYVDSFDVHPPLYYIVLKFVLSVVLPFKHTVILDILFSRLFSVLCTILTIHFLIKINNYFGITIKKHIQYLIFFLIPNVLFADNMNFSPSINIRMYALATLFVVLTMYYCIKYNNSEKIIHQVFIILFAELSAYTHYYAAVISGLFIFLYFLYFLYKKEIKQCLFYLLSGIIFFVLYIPWIVYGLSVQFRSLAFSAPLYKSVIQFIIAVFIILIFIVPYIYLYKNNNNNKRNDLRILFFINVIVILITTIYSVIKSPIFLIRYVYPSMIIMEFMSVCFVIQHFKNKEIRINRFIKFSILVLMPVVSLVSFVHESLIVSPISINLYKNDRYFSSFKGKYVNIDKAKYIVKDFDFNHSKLNNDTEYGLYLESIGKVPYVTNKDRYKYDLTNRAYPSIHFVPETVKYMKK